MMGGTCDKQHMARKTAQVWSAGQINLMTHETRGTAVLTRKKAQECLLQPGRKNAGKVLMTLPNTF